jgi:hypothetical protein
MIKKLTAVLKDRALRFAGLDVKAEYITSPPSAQNSLDIFKGEWASKMPPPYRDLNAGNAGLFEDGRITWLGEQLDNLDQLHVLECGPLEGGHTYMLEELGAASILAIEANTHAFLRCLIVKDLLGMQRSKFVLGDFVSHLRQGQRYDLVLACGVLYHLVNPVEAIALMSKLTDRVYVWTHYYDEEKIKGRAGLSHHFQSAAPAEYEGFKHSLYRQHYQARLGNAGFIGGSSHYSHWLTRDDLIGALSFFGFDTIVIQFDQRDTPAGPNISLYATRTK